MKWLHNCCNKNIGLLIFRIVVGGIFLIHGWEKFANMQDTITFFEQVKIPSFFAYVVATVETVGGVAIMLGIFSRYAAMLLSVVMVCAIAFVKWPFTLLSLDQAVLTGQLPADIVTFGFKAKQIFKSAEIDISLLGSLILLVTTGAGAFSIARWCKCKCNHMGLCKVCGVIGCGDVKKAMNCHNCNDCSGGKCSIDGENAHNHDHSHHDHHDHSHGSPIPPVSSEIR